MALVPRDCFLRLYVGDRAAGFEVDDRDSRARRAFVKNCQVIAGKRNADDARAFWYFDGDFAAGSDGKSEWLLHCYGSVGAGRGNAPDSGSGVELYAVTGQSPRQLDRNITPVGRGVQGMEPLSV